MFLLRRVPLLVLPFLMLCCKPEDPNGNDDDIPLVFISLEAGRDTIVTEDTTRIRATATGYELTYHWHVEKGDLLGSGAEITFLATPCTVGNNTIYCTILDGYSKSKVKEVVVTVL